MKENRRLSILVFLLIYVLSACQAVNNEEWQARLANWGDQLDKEAWQVGIMFGLEIPNSIPVNSIDQGRIAFVASSQKIEERDAIFVVSQNRQFVKIVDTDDLPVDMKFDGEVFWNPEGDRLAFSTYRLCPLDDGSAYRCEAAIFLIDVSTLNLEQISRQGEYADSPVWSPDGTQLLFRAADLEDPLSDDYFAERIDGGGRVRLSETAGQTVSWGQWSPDQLQFSFLAGDESGVAFRLIDLDAQSDLAQSIDLSYFGNDGESRARAITHSGFHWSPDGRYIAFSNGPESVAQRQNFLMDVSSGEISQLSQRTGLLVYGWLDEQTILAEDHLQGIVSLSLNGDLSSLVDGVLFPASECSISPNADALILGHYTSNLTIPQEDIYANFVWSVPEEEVITRIDLVDYVPEHPCWSQ